MHKATLLGNVHVPIFRRLAPDGEEQLPVKAGPDFGDGG
jgi:hypothetical protein